MRRIIETQGNGKARFYRKIIGVVVKIAIGYWLNGVSDAHGVTVLW